MPRFLSQLVTLASLGLAGMAHAGDPAQDLPARKQTSLGLYLTAQDTPGFLAVTPDALFIDIRTPQEVDETGLAQGIDALLPIGLVNPEAPDGALVQNPDFLPGLQALATERGLTANSPIVLICRSGNRSAVASTMLAQIGFQTVYTVTDGYLGDRGASGLRDVNGWRNARLPWQDRDASSCAPDHLGGQCP
ncbi:MAG: rhodanese-like domain-containing protein [Marinibacterium sp.]|nr:rhodanese-like domain-containing protein [Marinibacterium sp.]